MVFNNCKCPVCNSEVIHLNSIVGSDVAERVKGIMTDLEMPTLHLPNYTINKCVECALVFSDPMLAGDEQFYSWICKSKLYYPTVRWEWLPLIELLKSSCVANILDVGCGSGLFLKELEKNGLHGVGIDLNQASVEICQQQGLSAKCISIENLKDSEMPKFQAITLFHVLEHIDDPVAAVLSLRDCLEIDGLIAISVPLSPMSFEMDWVDPLNGPPHHLTCWNAKSLEALASAVGMSAKFFYQPSLPIMTRVLVSLQLKLGMPQVSGGSRFCRLAHHVVRLLTNPIVSAKILVNQYIRDRLTNGRKGDTILMVMSMRNS